MFFGLGKKKAGPGTPITRITRKEKTGNNVLKETWWVWAILILVALMMVTAKYWDKIEPLIPKH